MLNAEGAEKTLSEQAAGQPAGCGRDAGVGVCVIEGGRRLETRPALMVPGVTWGQVRGGGIWKQGFLLRLRLAWKL